MHNANFENLVDAFPADLDDREKRSIATRRQIAEVDPKAPVVGVALSGGGIRSATFCLGLFQSLARQKLIRRIDYLSTVSGGGYFGGFLGGAFARPQASPEDVERRLADSQSWEIRWLRDNGRFLSPNGAGDSWLAAAIGLRNWVALHVVMLTFGFLLLGFASLIRADLSASVHVGTVWYQWETYLWKNHLGPFWWSAWLLLPAASFVLLMVPSGTLYWVTQVSPLMRLAQRICVHLPHCDAKDWSHGEFVSRVQARLTRAFLIGLVVTVVLFSFVLVDSLGQTAYKAWSDSNFQFPAAWTALAATGATIYAFSSKAVTMFGDLLGKRKLQIPFSVTALGIAGAWLTVILCGLSALVCRFAWNQEEVVNHSVYLPMTGDWPLAVAVGCALALSCWFSYSFGFVNLSSLQQVYAARLSRAYIGATNPQRQDDRNYSMTEPIQGDDLPFENYQPQQNGGPLHLINVTVNETISGKSQIERRDRKGLNMALGPAGISVGGCSHAVWTHAATSHRAGPILRAFSEDYTRAIEPIASTSASCFHALQKPTSSPNAKPEPHRVESLSLGRWMAISGAAFTTGLGANTHTGMSLLLGLANVRLGYWWNSQIRSLRSKQSTPATGAELFSRFLSWLLPVQMSLLNEFFARFHGPTRQYWYLSDGGHFENTACYELIRRRVPFIVCSDAGQDVHYGFGDLANLVRIARTDFSAEVQVLSRKTDRKKEDPDPDYPLPNLEDLVNPDLLDVIGSLEDFEIPAAPTSDEGDGTFVRCRRHAVLARIHYVDTHQFSWLLLVKPSVMGDESVDVLQYQRTHPSFPQEPTSDQYFDEAQWESYRKLGEHIGAELFTRPRNPAAGWSPSDFCAPRPKTAAANPEPQPHPSIESVPPLPHLVV